MGSREDHPDIVCKADVVTRDGRKVKCNFYFATKLVVNELSDDEYVVLLRRELFRELLLIPRPNDDKSVNYRHYNNKTLAWNKVKEKVKEKVEEKVKERVKKKGKKKGKEKVKEKIEENADILLKFDARDHPGPNYLLQDCDELEKKRLRPAEHLLMLGAMTNLMLKIDENNKNLIETMNKNTILLVEAIKGIGISGESKKSFDSDITVAVLSNNLFNEIKHYILGLIYIYGVSFITEVNTEIANELSARLFEINSAFTAELDRINNEVNAGFSKINTELNGRRRKF
ncbi:hypothetical protein C1646_819912 [Rhizophagus diaphanus]|nr:hypothetical protein C1646_819912 [Rhizophagus diaphanus] [Rhizophagus sp. MUCL 43196]